MGWDMKRDLLLLAVVAALFAWSAWAGLAAIGVFIAWLAWLWIGDEKRKSDLKSKCRAQVEQALSDLGLEADGVFCGEQGIGAIGISQAGRKLVYTAPVSMETTVYDSDVAFEAHARKLPEGGFEIGMTVPGRVTKKPRTETVRVKQRSEAERWVKTLKPLLGSKVRSDL